MLNGVFGVPQKGKLVVPADLERDSSESLKPTSEPCHTTVNGRELKWMMTRGRLVGIGHDGGFLLFSARGHLVSFPSN